MFKCKSGFQMAILKLINITIISLLIMYSCNQREEGSLCRSLNQIKKLEGKVVRLQGTLTRPTSKRFPPTIHLNDGTNVAFIASEELQANLTDTIKSFFGKKIQARGIIYWKNSPSEIENRLNIPYLLDMDYIITIE